MKWLFVTSRFPWPLIHGVWLRVYHLTRTLREQGDEVSILSYEGCSEGAKAYAEAGVMVMDGPKGCPPSRGKPRCWLGPYVYDDLLAKHVADVAGRYDIVVLVGLHTLQYAREASLSGRVVADMIDDPILEEGRRFWSDLYPRRCLRRLVFLAGEFLYERSYLDLLDLATFVAEEDVVSFRRRHQNARAETVPNGVDVCYFTRHKQARSDTAGGARIVFTGCMSNPNNERAAIFLVRKIAPIIWKAHPAARVQIVGADPTKKVLSLAGPKVEVTGCVDDVRPYLWDADVVLIPMLTGTGIKNKLLEAWAAGSAVVATSLACQGVPTENDRNLLVGNSPEELASCAVRVIENEVLRARLAGEGHKTVQRYLTWSVVANRLREEAMKRKVAKRQCR